jgi:hypothetical protein
MADKQQTNPEQTGTAGTAPRTARVGAGGVLIVDHEIKPPDPAPRAFEGTPFSHRDLPETRVAEVGDSQVLVHRPFGSEPRNFDPETGRSAPASPEQREEIMDSHARRVAASQVRDEEEQRKTREAAERARTGGVPQEKIDQQKKALQDEGKKGDGGRKEMEGRRKAASDEARRATEAAAGLPPPANSAEETAEGNAAGRAAGGRKRAG